MKIVSIVLGVILAAGLATAAYMLNAPEPQRPAISTDPAEYFDQSGATEDRIRALEAAVAEERDARQLLEEELQVLYAEIERLDEARDRTRRVAQGNIAEAVEQRTRRIRGTGTPEDRRLELIEGGFSPDRAEWIAQRESELLMQAMQARFEARVSGEPFDRFDPSLNPATSLRAEIGDTEYEQYLEASNRPTAVAVGSVLESSPGQRAGLQAGDEIMRYDGQRVFNTQDLNRQTMQGEPGESIVVDLRRDGVLMQVVLPRGPIGVSTGRRPGRR